MIALSSGKRAMVDDEDYIRLSSYKWSVMKTWDGMWYAFRTASTKGGKPKRTVYLHRAILNAPKNKMVDHRNGKTLDCRRKNIRLADKYQNQWNRKKVKNASGYKGVRRNSKNRWDAGIVYRGKYRYLGNFKDPKDAAKAYDRAALRLFGDFARINKA